jgi:transposase
MRRRNYSREFKLSAIALVQQQGYTIPQAAKSLGVDVGSLRTWLKKFPLDQDQPSPDNASALQAELRRLREENRRLTMEREILKKATAFFAKESP